jgi:hypothetical protein
MGYVHSCLAFRRNSALLPTRKRGTWFLSLAIWMDPMISRRGLLRFLFSGLAVFTGAAGYAFGYGPMQAPRIARYQLTPRGWPKGYRLRIAMLSDIHAVEPWMSAERLRGIVESANALEADITLLLGDYTTGLRKYRTGIVPDASWASVLGHLKAPLGVHAVLGNHDWWDDPAVQRNGGGIPEAQRALEAAGIAVYHNAARRIAHRGRHFWLAGLGDQLALWTGQRHRWQSLADLPATLKQCDTDDPVLLMAHEPNIFPAIPDRVSLTLTGHTHGGQVNLFGWRPIPGTPLGSRYSRGHIHDQGRDLVISSGLGCSIYPIRVGVPPEIVLIDMGAT